MVNPQTPTSLSSLSIWCCHGQSGTRPPSGAGSPAAPCPGRCPARSGWSSCATASCHSRSPTRGQAGSSWCHLQSQSMLQHSKRANSEYAPTVFLSWVRALGLLGPQGAAAVAPKIQFQGVLLPATAAVHGTGHKRVTSGNRKLRRVARVPGPCRRAIVVTVAVGQLGKHVKISHICFCMLHVPLSYGPFPDGVIAFLRAFSSLYRFSRQNRQWLKVIVCGLEASTITLRKACGQSRQVVAVHNPLRLHANTTYSLTALAVTVYIQIQKEKSLYTEYFHFFKQ